MGASICCVGPFFLMATGISGAWMSRLMILEPYQPIFIFLVSSLFAAAAWSIFAPMEKAIASGDSCPISALRMRQKAAFFTTGALVTILLTSAHWIPIVA